jgi:hypothetical protein
MIAKVKKYSKGLSDKETKYSFIKEGLGFNVQDDIIDELYNGNLFNVGEVNIHDYIINGDDGTSYIE